MEDTWLIDTDAQMVFLMHQDFRPIFFSFFRYWTHRAIRPRGSSKPSAARPRMLVRTVMPRAQGRRGGWHHGVSHGHVAVAWEEVAVRSQVLDPRSFDFVRIGFHVLKGQDGSQNFMDFHGLSIWFHMIAYASGWMNINLLPVCWCDHLGASFFFHLGAASGPHWRWVCPGLITGCKENR